MNTLKFKTNVKCGGCIATVTPHLNLVKGIVSWNVDTTDPLKIMTVETEGISAEEIISVMKTAGYQAELILSE
jgi:copper chaperone